MADRAQIDRAKNASIFINQFDPQSLKKTGEYDFADSIKDAEDIKLLFKPLRPEVFERLPNNILNNLGQQLHDAAELLRRAQVFQPSAVQNPNEERKRIQSDLRSACERTLGSPNELTAAIVQSLDVRALSAQVDLKAAELQALVDKAGNTIQEGMAVLDEARKELGKINVRNEAQRFAEEAGRYRVASRWWLGASIMMALGIAAFAVFAHLLLDRFGVTPDDFGKIQYFSSKVLIIISLLYLLHFCGRSYVAARHNETVNRHRSNALSTYRLLVESASEDRSRDVVLAAAAGAIFAPQDTGYLKQSSEVDLTRAMLDRVGKSS